MVLTHYHRLILPTDSNHHGTLYAGSLLRLALEEALDFAGKGYLVFGVAASVDLERSARRCSEG